MLIAQAIQQNAGISHEATAGYIAAGIAGLSFVISCVAVFLSGKANNINKNIAKRQGVIDLHNAWSKVNQINRNNSPVGPDITLASNAISLTAVLWNHDVIEKEILYQQYWPEFERIYLALKGWTIQVPGYTRDADSFITKEVTVAYKQMEERHLKDVKSTNT